MGSLQQPGYVPDQARHAAWLGEFQAMMRLAWPLVVTQLAQFSLVTTDVIMMGWLGSDFLAAGTLVTAFFGPFYLFCVGVLSATAPLMSEALGAGDYTSVRRSMRQGLWVSIVLGAIVIVILSQTAFFLLAMGQEPSLVALSDTYVGAAIWHLLPASMFVVLRTLVAAHDDTRIVLWVTIIGIGVNALGNYCLMFGAFGFPRLELLGAGIATSIVHTVMTALLLVYILRRQAYRAYDILVRFWKPDWQRFVRILALGVPTGLMLVAEASMFGASAMLMGWLGREALAAHAVALQLTSIAFMAPLGLSHAATIRVGLAKGRGSLEGIRQAGWLSMGVTLLLMCLTGSLFLLFPNFLVGLFLDASLADNAPVIALAVGFLGIAGLFQLMDGGQVVITAVLRGLSDTAVPMWVGMFGYWIVGMGSSYMLAFPLGFGGRGLWMGLALGLCFVSVFLTLRFFWRERLGLVRAGAQNNAG